MRGIKLSKKDLVIGMVAFCGGVKKKELDVLTVTSKGFAKRTHIDEYRVQSRAGKGVINIKLANKIGEVMGVSLVSPHDELMCITQKGILIRVKVKDIRTTGRATQGVKIINLEAKDKLATIARIISEESTP